MPNYLRTIVKKVAKPTPPSQPLDPNQVRNSAGGYSYPVDEWTQLQRFLVLGSEGGSYYATEHSLTKENAAVVQRCAYLDGPRTVETIAGIAEAGRAPKADPALLALAIVAGIGDAETRQLALAALPRVARTGTHLLHFAAFADAQRGWGRGLRSAVAKWYQMPANRLAFQALKYQQRDGWSHRDLLRLTHAKPASDQHTAIFHWLVKGWDWVGEEPHPDPALVQIWAAERAKRATTADEIVELIERHRLPREVIPTNWLKEPAVWAALLRDMPMTALIRNLATLTRIGLLTPDSATTAEVVARLTNADRLRQARVHPIQVLAASTTYATGRGVRGQNVWQPTPAISEALDRAFKLSFAAVEPTGKRFLIGLDVSGSMGTGQVAGVPGLTPRAAAAAMALLWAQTERQVEVMAFSGETQPAAGHSGYSTAIGMTRFPIGRGDSLASVVERATSMPFGPTDCALPMKYALQRGLEVDAFVVLTDSETWFGDTHPMAALRAYREKTGIASKLIVVGMVANKFSIADPNDAGALDVVGFDTIAPTLIAEFVTGDLFATTSGRQPAESDDTDLAAAI